MPIARRAKKQKRRACFCSPFLRCFCLLDLFCNLCSLAYAAAQVVQLVTANLTVADNLELSNVRGMYREGLLNAYAVRDAANGYGLVNTSVLLGNDDALEYLNTLAVALLDLCVYLYGVTDLESRQIALALLLGQYVYEIQFSLILSS